MSAQKRTPTGAWDGKNCLNWRHESPPQGPLVSFLTFFLGNMRPTHLTGQWNVHRHTSPLQLPPFPWKWGEATGWKLSRVGAQIRSLGVPMNLWHNSDVTNHEGIGTPALLLTNCGYGANLIPRTISRLNACHLLYKILGNNSMICMVFISQNPGINLDWYAR